MICVLTTGELIPGKRGEWEQIVAKELLPLYSKLGIKQVGSFHGYTGNMNLNYTLYAYDDLAAVQKMRETQQKSKEFQAVSAKLNATRVGLTYTILESNPWSPLK